MTVLQAQALKEYSTLLKPSGGNRHVWNHICARWVAFQHASTCSLIRHQFLKDIDIGIALPFRAFNSISVKCVVGGGGEAAFLLLKKPNGVLNRLRSMDEKPLFWEDVGFPRAFFHPHAIAGIVPVLSGKDNALYCPAAGHRKSLNKPDAHSNRLRDIP